MKKKNRLGLPSKKSNAEASTINGIQGSDIKSCSEQNTIICEGVLKIEVIEEQPAPTDSLIADLNLAAVKPEDDVFGERYADVDRLFTTIETVPIKEDTTNSTNIETDKIKDGATISKNAAHVKGKRKLNTEKNCSVCEVDRRDQSADEQTEETTVEKNTETNKKIKKTADIECGEHVPSGEQYTAEIVSEPKNTENPINAAVTEITNNSLSPNRLTHTTNINSKTPRKIAVANLSQSVLYLCPCCPALFKSLNTWQDHVSSKGATWNTERHVAYHGLFMESASIPNEISLSNGSVNLKAVAASDSSNKSSATKRKNEVNNADSNSGSQATASNKKQAKNYEMPSFVSEANGSMAPSLLPAKIWFKGNSFNIPTDVVHKFVSANTLTEEERRQKCRLLLGGHLNLDRHVLTPSEALSKLRIKTVRNEVRTRDYFECVMFDVNSLLSIVNQMKMQREQNFSPPNDVKQKQCHIIPTAKMQLRQDTLNMRLPLEVPKVLANGTVIEPFQVLSAGNTGFIPTIRLPCPGPARPPPVLLNVHESSPTPNLPRPKTPIRSYERKKPTDPSTQHLWHKVVDASPVSPPLVILEGDPLRTDDASVDGPPIGTTGQGEKRGSPWEPQVVVVETLRRNPVLNELANMQHFNEPPRLPPEFKKIKLVAQPPAKPPIEDFEQILPVHIPNIDLSMLNGVSITTVPKKS